MSDNFKLERLQMLLSIGLGHVAVGVFFVDFVGFGLEYNINLILRILEQTALIWQHLENFGVECRTRRFLQIIQIGVRVKIDLDDFFLFLFYLIMFGLLF